MRTTYSRENLCRLAEPKCSRKLHEGLPPAPDKVNPFAPIGATPIRRLELRTSQHVVAHAVANAGFYLAVSPGGRTVHLFAMRPLVSFFVATVLSLPAALRGDAPAMSTSPHHLFVGTYTQKDSQGIYSVSFDSATGALGAPVLAAETKNPSYLALTPDRRRLYAVNESEAMAVAFGIESDHQHLVALQEPQPARGKASCHLVVDQTAHALMVANYHTGVVASFALRADGSIGAAGSVLQHTGSGPNPERQAGPHAHCVVLSPDNRFIFSCDLGLDKIFAYRLDPVAATLTPAETPFTSTAPGSGPRHLAFSPDGRHAFLLTEMGATVTSFRYDGDRGTLTPIDTRSTLDPHSGFTGENRSAAIRVHPNGRFVYASNRGPDSLAVFAIDPATAKLTLVEIVPSGGLQPRDFILSPDGRWLIAAHQDSNSLVVFQLDPATGRLTKTASTAKVSMPVCVLFAD